MTPPSFGFSLKWARLPRSQRLRKIAKLFSLLENSLVRGVSSPAGAEAARAAFALLCDDGSFAPAAHTALAAAHAAFSAPGLPPRALLRPLNTARHIVLAETGQSQADWDFIDHSGGLDPARRRVFPGMAAYLDDIRSPFNVGAMFRAAESFGVERLFLSPLAADPGHPRARRTAMGCTEILPWTRASLAEACRGAGTAAAALPVFALETGGVSPDAFPFPREGVMIAGSEELGVSPEALVLADASLGRLSIPVFGAKGSLNVSVAFGIALHAWARRLASGGAIDAAAGD
ncbi:MAG: TrmH family RNA methyltransferase [Spirochaetaceae bacterium]|jgi:TrmH family RNA methyltransferase|nr:TrmH family RNA methyltransferase [Spirochaetaceae bacterium]